MMERMTFTVPPALKKRVQAAREINWSAVVVRALEERLGFWEEMDELLKHSKLTEKDVDEISHSIKRNMARYYEKKFGISSSTRTK